MGEIITYIFYLLLLVSVIGYIHIIYVCLKLGYKLVTKLGDTLQSKYNLIDYIKSVGIRNVRIMRVFSYIYILTVLMWVLTTNIYGLIEGTEFVWLVGVLGIFIYLVTEFSLKRLISEG